MAKVPAYPVEFRLRAVELYRSSGLTAEKAAREVGVSATTLGNWSRQAAIGGTGKLTVPAATFAGTLGV